MNHGRSRPSLKRTAWGLSILLAAPFGLPAPAGARAHAPARGANIGMYRISPAMPVLYGAKPTRVTVRLWATGAQIVNVESQGPTGAARKVQAVKIGSSGGTDIYEAAFTLDRNQPTGAWQVRMSGWDGDIGVTRRIATMPVRRATSLASFNARPERVLFGRRLLLIGRFRRLDPYAVHTASYIPYGGARVKVYFSKQKPYPRVWKYVTSIKVRKSGKFWKKVKVRQDGTWRLSFPGDGTYAPSHSRADYIGIRWT